MILLPLWIGPYFLCLVNVDFKLATLLNSLIIAKHSLPSSFAISMYEIISGKIGKSLVGQSGDQQE